MERDNIMQRLFDAFPPYPRAISVYSLTVVFPFYERRSIEKAISRLRVAGCVEPAGLVGVWRKCKGATPPIDRRGHGKGGRKPKRQA